MQFDREVDKMIKDIKDLDKRITRLEAEEEREAVQGTIRPETRRGRKPKK